MTTDAGAVIRRHSKSFSLAARLLAPAARSRAERLYAWCRTADDAVDKAPNRAEAVRALAELRADLEAVYEGRTASAEAGMLLTAIVAETNMPRDYPEALLDGMAMDLDGVSYRTLDELLPYCHRVAGVVGCMMCHALGVSDDRATLHAAHLGIAMQLTNIARDVAEDWSHGRLYLPLEWLNAVPDPNELLDDDAVAPAVERLLREADRYYASGNEGLKFLDRRSRFAVRTASRVYAAIGAEVRRRGCRPSAGRAIVSRSHKLRLVSSAAVSSLFEAKPPESPAEPRTIRHLEPLTAPPEEMTMTDQPTTAASRRETLSTAAFGLALVLLLSSAMFIFVGIYPKNEEYENTPYLYAAICAIAGSLSWTASYRLGRTR